jgi:methylglutaconyl-CoA hydratase
LWPFLIYRAMVTALGERRVIELALTGRIFDAEEGKILSLVQHIHEDPNAKAMEIGEQLAASSGPAIRGGLNFAQEARDKDWEMAGLIARSMREELFQSPDFHEGVKAFREKRKPVWPSLTPKT